jgi:hypothetical protein
MASRRVRAPLAVAPALALALMASGASAEPTAADRETARQLMEDGRTLRGKNDLKGALERFKAADDIMHVPTTGLEVARTQVPLGLLVEARDTIARIRLIPAKASDPVQFNDARLKADQLDASLDGRVSRLVVVVHGAPSGQALAVSIDGVPVPAAVIGLPRPVDPGHHLVVVQTEGAGGRADGRGEVDVREGDTKSLDVTLVRTATAAPSAAPPEPAVDAGAAETPGAPRTSHAPYALTYGAGAVAAAGLVVGVVTGVMSWSKTSSLSSACPSHTCPPASYSSYDSANDLATIATVSFAAAGVGACLAVVSLVVGHEEKTETASPSARLRVSPWMGAGAAGLRGAF